MTSNPKVRILADKFKTCVHEALTSDELLAVDAANCVRDDGSCATHDYFDANEAMIEAFELLDWDIGLGNEGGMPQETVDLINAAWTLAKTEGFSK